MLVNNRFPNIKGFLLDMDGTFYLGDRLIEGALRLIKIINQMSIKYLFLTNNSSKHPQQYAGKLLSLGLPVSENQIFTSGEATALYISNLYPNARCFIVGTTGLVEQFTSYGLLPVTENPDFAVLGFDTTLTYSKLWQLCNLVKAGYPYIATHPDINCPIEDGVMPDIGAIIAFVQASTGRLPDQIIGKPNRMIVELAATRLNLPITSLGMIGDRLYTDIALGKTSGVKTILVLSGETRLSDLQSSPIKPDFIFNHLGQVADWIESSEGNSPPQ